MDLFFSLVKPSSKRFAMPFHLDAIICHLITGRKGGKTNKTDTNQYSHTNALCQQNLYDSQLMQ
jgi:hypothetical protein